MNWDVEVARVYTLHTDTSGDLRQISDHPCGSSVEMRTFIPTGWSLMLYHNTEIASSNNLLRICLQ